MARKPEECKVQERDPTGRYVKVFYFIHHRCFLNLFLILPSSKPDSLAVDLSKRCIRVMIMNLVLKSLGIKYHINICNQRSGNS